MEKKELIFDPQLVVDIQNAARKAGLDLELVRRALTDSELLRDLGEILLGHKEISEVELRINTSNDPIPVMGLTWRHHSRFGSWRLDPTQLELYQSERQKKGDRERVDRLISKLLGGGWLSKRKRRLSPNACVIDYLHRHPKRLPISWWSWLEGAPNRTIFFLGTIYADEQAFECVRCLSLNPEGRLSWNSRRLTATFGPDDAVVLMIP